jgi:uncharacterized RmlC-like cupin family protein
MPEKHGELEIIRAMELRFDSARQSERATPLSGVDSMLMSARKIWMGKVSKEPGYRSVANHHVEAQTAGYCLKASARIDWGARFEEFVDLDEGDFVFVPPYFPHIEANRSTENELVWLTAQTPASIVVNMEERPSDVPGRV